MYLYRANKIPTEDASRRRKEQRSCKQKLIPPMSLILGEMRRHEEMNFLFFPLVILPKDNMGDNHLSSHI